MDKMISVLKNYDDTLEEVKALSGGKATLVLATKTVEKDILEALSRERSGLLQLALPVLVA